MQIKASRRTATGKMEKCCVPKAGVIEKRAADAMLTVLHRWKVEWALVKATMRLRIAGLGGEGDDFNNKACLFHAAECRETTRTSEILLFS